jgi:hypothetical protein
MSLWVTAAEGLVFAVARAVMITATGGVGIGGSGTLEAGRDRQRDCSTPTPADASRSTRGREISRGEADGLPGETASTSRTRRRRVRVHALVARRFSIETVPVFVGPGLTG